MHKTLSLYMVKNPVSIQEDLSIKDVMKRMHDMDISHLLVTDKDNKLLGVISKEDTHTKLKSLISKTTGKTFTELILKSATASEIMTKNYIPVKPDDSLEYGVELLLQNEFHCLPVIENDQAVGIITSYDLLKGYYQEYG